MIRGKFKKILLFLFVFCGVCTVSAWASEGGHGSSLVERTSLLVLQLSVILFAARIASSIFYKFKLPGVLGEIFIGVIIGPYLLGSIPVWGFEHGIFPLAGDFPVTIELYSLASIAAIILLFFVGLETDITTFLKFSVAGSVLGIFGVIASFVAGDYVGILLSHYILGVDASFFSLVPLFLGVISTATSVGITARILSVKKKMNSPEGVTILAAAVVDDVLGIIIFAVVLGVAKRGNIGVIDVSLITLKAVAIWFVFTFLGFRYSRAITKLLKRMKDRATIAVMTFGLALFLAGIFEKAGLAMIIGSYVAGLSLSKTDMAFIIQEKLEGLEKFFVPIFFCVMGMLINVHTMMSVEILVFGLIYVVFAVVGKLVGCGIPALFLNFNLRGALRIGVGMVPRGEVALIIAGVGLSSGIINDEVFNIVMIMTFVTTLIAPIVLNKMLDNNKLVLRKKQKETEETKSISYDMPNVETAEILRTKIVDTLEEEGFLVHRMSGQEKLYQIRKEDTFIVFHYSPKVLIFDCLGKDTSFVHTLFYEVIAELEHSMKCLQTLTDKTVIGKKIFEEQDGAVIVKTARKKKKFKIASSLALNVDLKGKTGNEVVNELIDLLIISKQLDPKHREQVYKELLAREEIMSTGMTDGIALPHARTDAVDNVIGVVGISKEGIEFGSLDQVVSKIFILTLAPKKNPHAYLQSISEISKFLAKEENRYNILSCETSMQLFDLFNQM